MGAGEPGAVFFGVLGCESGFAMLLTEKLFCVLWLLAVVTVSLVVNKERKQETTLINEVRQTNVFNSVLNGEVVRDLRDSKHIYWISFVTPFTGLDTMRYFICKRCTG